MCAVCDVSHYNTLYYYVIVFAADGRRVSGFAEYNMGTRDNDPGIVMYIVVFESALCCGSARS